MAIFSRKPKNDNIKLDQKAAGEPKANQAGDEVGTVTATAQGEAVIIGGRGNKSLVFPRLSEKSSLLTRLNKYVFKVEGQVNKIDLRKAIEKAYDVKIARINMINTKGKYRRYGRASGKTSGFKKAVVTLKPDSKKINLIES